MEKIKISDVAEMVIEEADAQFGSLWKIDEEKYDAFKTYLRGLQEAVDAHDAISFTAEVDDMLMTIKATIEASDFTVEDENDVLYALMEQAINTRFFVSEDGNAAVEYEYPSIWVRT